MIPARAMAPFAARLILGLFCRSNGLEMRVFIKVQPDVGMARFADLATHEFIRRLRCCGERQSEQYKREPFHESTDMHLHGLQFPELCEPCETIVKPVYAAH